MKCPRTGDLRELWANDDELKVRAEEFRSRDPFPSVPRGLLSSSEIRDYIRVTGMLDNFEEDHLKAASYEVFAGKQFIYWEGNKRKKKVITKKDYFLTLPENSITFVQTDCFFRLPSYIAVRFNLRIAHVHRGLLLGTGPLVDPGFHGRLLVPLHNFTSSEYRMDLREALIWIEFTKTTAHFDRFTIPERMLHQADRKTAPKRIPVEKTDRDPDYYLFKASGGAPIVSSIPDALVTAKNDAKEARKTSEGLQTWARGIGVLAVLGAILGVGGVVTTSWSTIRSSQDAVDRANASMTDLDRRTRFLDDKTAVLQTTADRIRELETARATLGADLKRANERADQLQGRIDLLIRRLDERPTR